MSGEQISRINSLSFVISLAAVIAGVVVGSLGIWRIIPTDGGVLWRALGTCGVGFGGSVAASMAIRCFKTNE